MIKPDLQMYKKSIASARLCHIDYSVLVRLLLMFKLTLLLLLLAVSQAGAEVFAQRASLHVTNKPLKEVFDELRKKTGFRSEEHTSELQSLMRISYAVFCLKKKINKTKTTTT